MINLYIHIYVYIYIYIYIYYIYIYILYIYINVASNHPQRIKKQLAKTISDGLSQNSPNADILNNIKLEYEEALKKCGYSTNLTYTLPNPEQNNARQK